jgi:hypothetical protein
MIKSRGIDLMPGISNDEFMAEKIARTTVEREFRPLEINKKDGGELQIRFSSTDAIAFANLLLSQSLSAETHPNAFVTVCCPTQSSERIQIVSTWLDAETLQEADTAARKAANLNSTSVP